MTDSIFYMIGVVIALIGYIVLVSILGFLAYLATNKTIYNLVRYRRISWVRYWYQYATERGCIPHDVVYRELVAKNPPRTIEEAEAAEREVISIIARSSKE